jgi:hypothetical protein
VASHARAQDFSERDRAGQGRFRQHNQRGPSEPGANPQGRASARNKKRPGRVERGRALPDRASTRAEVCWTEPRNHVASPARALLTRRGACRHGTTFGYTSTGPRWASVLPRRRVSPERSQLGHDKSEQKSDLAMVVQRTCASSVRVACGNSTRACAAGSCVSRREFQA